MAYRTFGDLSQQVQMELDIQDEEFIQPQELINYFNSGITIIESEIVKLGCKEKYLQTEDFISVVAGQQDYNLPDDIIEEKIRKIVFRDNTNIYTLKPFKEEQAYEAEDVARLYSSNDYYQYQLYKIGEDPVLRIIPPAYQSVTDAIRIIYFKDLNRYDDDDTNCDIPAVCYEYLLSYVRYRVYMKETHVNMASEAQILEGLTQLMRETLQNQVADPDMDLVDLDLSHYEEMS